MAQFMDVHRGMKGITADELLEAHHCDIDFQDDEGVNFKQAWADPVAGVVFCLSEAPNAKAVEKTHERAGNWVQEVYEVSIEL